MNGSNSNSNDSFQLRSYGVYKLKLVVQKARDFFRGTALKPCINDSIKMTKESLVDLKEDSCLKQLIEDVFQHRSEMSAKQLFSMKEGAMLPCWLDSDLNESDDWLTNSSYYPLYYDLFSRLGGSFSVPSMLEIGVRTGYMGVVFFKALNRQARYVGVDPNRYVANGLELASHSLKSLSLDPAKHSFFFLRGYSWDLNVQDSLYTLPKFDFIHIDGDHSIPGKMLDLELASCMISDKGYVLVDDFDHYGFIPECVQRALSIGWFTKYAYLKTMRGLAILQK